VQPDDLALAIGVHRHSDYRRHRDDAAALALALVTIRLAARPASGGFTYGLKRAEILSAQVQLASSEGLFAEPASAAPLALLFRLVREGKIAKDAITVVVLTGSGLKDPDAALKNVEPPIELDGDARTLAKVLKL
jgi:threonine synthase